jgi:hypothetical protein
LGAESWIDNWSMHRVTSAEEIRPEEAINSRADEETSENRRHIESRGESLFNQHGFVTDSMREVDASKELQRTQKEAKARNREDRIKRGSFD